MQASTPETSGVRSALTLLVERDKRARLARELDKLNPKEERRITDKALGAAPWPE